MAGYREPFIKYLGSLAQLWSIPQLQKWSNTQLLLPVYHTVSNSRLAHIQHLYPVKNAATFEKEIDLLLKHFEAIDPTQLIDHLHGKQRLKKPSFLLTFDDGLKEFHDVIAPILERKGLTAICFLNSAFIDNKDLFFRYKASLLIDFIQKDTTTQLSKINEILKGEDYKDYLLNVTYDNRSVLDEIAATLGYDFDDYLKQSQPYLNKDEIKSLIQKGFYFGAHSIDHPEYQYLHPDEQIRQTEESTLKIKDWFGLDYSYFAFPFTDYGVKSVYFNQVDFVDLSFGSAGLKEDNAKNHLQRVPLEMGELNAKHILKGEMLYTVIRKLLGKNRIDR